MDTPALPENIYVTLHELIEMRRRVSELPLFTAAKQRGALSGLHHSKLRGRGVDFDQVRIYQPGDDIRTIDWRVTARTQEPHTKLFHEERERPIYLIVEQSAALFFGSRLAFKSVLAARAAALIGWAALEHHDRVGGLLFGNQGFSEVRPGRDKRSLLQLLNQISAHNQALNTDLAVDPLALEQALQRAREVLRPGSLAILLCDERALTETVEQQLQWLARRVDVLLLPISDPLDHRLPRSSLRYQQGKQSFWINGQQRQFYKAYRQAAFERQTRWEQLGRRTHSPLMPLSTAFDVLEQLRAYLLGHPLTGAKT